MIALFIVTLALMELADVNACDQMACFEHVKQYQTLQDFIPRLEEVGHSSFCKDANETLRCLNEAQQDGDCPELISHAMAINAMRALCQGEHAGGRSLTGVEFSACATLVNLRERLVMINRNCETEWVTYDLEEQPCGISVQGKLCMLREMNRICGPAYTAYINGMWEAFGMNACKPGGGIMGGSFGAFFPQMTMPKGEQ